MNIKHLAAAAFVLLLTQAALLPGANAADTSAMDLPGVRKTFAASCMQGFRPKDVATDKREEVCGCVSGHMVDSLTAMPQAQFDAIGRNDQAAIKRWTGEIVEYMAVCAKPMFQSMMRETSLQGCHKNPRAALGRDSAILPDGSDACQCIADHMGETPIEGAFKEAFNSGEIDQHSGQIAGRKLAEDALVKARQACVPADMPPATSTDAPAVPAATLPANAAAGSANTPALQGN